MERNNRLIEGFKTQKRSTIEKHLDALAENYVVYSEHFKGIRPHLENNDIYVYAHQMNVVVVCLDTACNKDELVDEEPFNGEPPLYFTEISRRRSPVWQLNETLKIIRQKLSDAQMSRTVWGVLLTGSNFINGDDWQEIWEGMNITVIDNLKSLSKWRFDVNPDEDLTYGTTVIEAIEDIAKRAEPTADNPCSEFDILLGEFLCTQTGEPKGDEKEKLEKVEDDIDDLDDIDVPDDDEDDDDDVSDYDINDEYNPSSALPSGIIEQNNNVKTKVEVLPPLANPRAELDKLVGCEDIKRHIDQLLAVTRYNKMLRETYPDAKPLRVSLHSVFFGRPGTGKTTVCKIYGSLLHEAGVLSKGHVVIADRGAFLGTLWGDEERSVRQVLEMAQGGVLMIDEAYLLNGKNENDPGRMVINLLMNMLADEKQRDIAVVLCGYKEQMMQLLNTNPGIPSRFPNRFEFSDFTIDELLEITSRRIGEYKYRFTEDAWQKFRDVLTSAYNVRDPLSWGNARFIANQLDHIFIQHAQRCVQECPGDSEQLLLLTPPDIQPIDVTRPRPRIGF